MRSVTPPGSVAGSSAGVSPRVPWTRRTERRQQLRLGAVSKSPVNYARHTPAALASSSFLDEYDDAESLIRLRRSNTVAARALRPSASATDMLANQSAMGDGSFMSAGGLTASGVTMAAAAAACRRGAPSDGSMLSPRGGRRLSLAARLGGGSDRYRYLRALYMGSHSDMGTPDEAPPPTPMGVPSLNFRKYDFALSRQFTFSDGTSIRMPQDNRG